MKMTKKLERAAGTLLSVNSKVSFDLGPVCALLKEAHDYILELEAAAASLEGAEPFVDWLASEMPPGTIIGDPYWWAKRIAKRALYYRHPPSAPEGLVAIHDWLLALSCYPDSYPMDAMKSHLRDLQHKLSIVLSAAPQGGGDE